MSPSVDMLDISLFDMSWYDGEIEKVTRLIRQRNVGQPETATPAGVARSWACSQLPARSCACLQPPAGSCVCSQLPARSCACLQPLARSCACLSRRRARARACSCRRARACTGAAAAPVRAPATAAVMAPAPAPTPAADPAIAELAVLLRQLIGICCFRVSRVILVLTIVFVL